MLSDGPGPRPTRPGARSGLGGLRTFRPRHGGVMALIGLVLALLGAAVIVRWDIAVRREAFAVEARIAHRLLSQRAAQLDAVLATLSLLSDAADAQTMAARLPALWPAVLAVHYRDERQAWADAALAAAEAQSRALAGLQRHAVLAALDGEAAHYSLVLAGAAAGWAMRVDAKRLVPADEWPLSDSGPIRAELVSGEQVLVLHRGASPALRPAGLTPGFTFAKVLATPSQSFELRLQRATGPAQWPWAWLLLWTGFCAAMTAGLLGLRGAREAQLRQARLVRMGQVARLNALGELAAGMAHELNQPLAAVLASTQAAQRLLKPEEATPGAVPDACEHDLQAVREALGLAAAQARRASDVLLRMRRLVKDAGRAAVPREVDLHALCAQLLRLMDPELRRRGVRATLSGTAPPLWVDPVMLEQVIHNLVSNAMQAQEGAATPEPHIELRLQADMGHRQARLCVRDNGPGFSEEALAKAFEPFFSSRNGGLGLGLPLCETLLETMGGSLRAHNIRGPDGRIAGAELVLTLAQTAQAPAEPGRPHSQSEP